MLRLFIVTHLQTYLLLFLPCTLFSSHLELLNIIRVQIHVHSDTSMILMILFFHTGLPFPPSLFMCLLIFAQFLEAELMMTPLAFVCLSSLCLFFFLLSSHIYVNFITLPQSHTLKCKMLKK